MSVRTREDGVVSPATSGIWQPTAAHLRDSGVARLMRALDVPDYDAMRSLSVNEPARYWSVVTSFCEIAWTTPPSGYVSVPEGIEFPRWFPGGQLNWVNTALQWGKRPATANTRAVVGESEDDTVRNLTHAELAVR